MEISYRTHFDKNMVVMPPKKGIRRNATLPPFDQRGIHTTNKSRQPWEIDFIDTTSVTNRDAQSD
jgi:hypothetical protein